MTKDATLSRRWPKDLVQRIAKQDFVLVVGAGMSAACTNASGARPPSWRLLLQTLNREFATGDARKTANTLIDQGNLLDAAELIKTCAAEKSRDKDFVRFVAESVDGKQSDHFRASELHNTLMRLDPRLLVTTNYDSILERASKNGFRVKTYDSTDIGHEVRTGVALLLKVHGTVDTEQKLILTRSDYSKLRRDGQSSLRVLESLFLTKTTLFVGYGMGDPDIQLLLENNFARQMDSGAHYILIGDAIPRHQRSILLRSYGVQPITFKQDDYYEAGKMLELLADLVDVERFSMSSQV